MLKPVLVTALILEPLTCAACLDARRLHRPRSARDGGRAEEDPSDVPDCRAVLEVRQRGHALFRRPPGVGVSVPTVFVVEDHADTRELYVEVLRAKGWHAIGLATL